MRHLAWAAAVVLGWATLAAQAPSSDARNSGRQLFVTYCASCHGSSARGNGPIADTLRVRPADLTQLAKRNGALFPTAKTYRIIDGRDVGAHGNPDMPIWGDAFMRREGLNDAAVKARIEAILRYLESIQERAGH